MIDKRVKYALPRAENLLRIVTSNIIDNIRRGNDAIVSIPPLLQRAYTIVNEIDVLPYKDLEDEES